MKKLLFVLFLMFICPWQFSLAEDSDPKPTTEPSNLSRLAEMITSLQTSIKKQSSKEISPEQQQDLAKLKNNFLEIATGVDQSEVLGIIEEKFSWSNELQILLSPVLTELKEISSRPREIDNLKKDIQKLRFDINKNSEMIQALNKLKDQSTEESLLKYLKNITQELQTKRKKIQTELSILQQRLESRLLERKSFGDSIEGIFDIFFKTRAKNLILTFVVCFFYLVSLNITSRGASKFFSVLRIRSIAFARAQRVLYLSLLIAGSLIVYSTTLFYLEDWLLLSLSALLGLAIIWSGKQLLPRFWTQLVLLMNSGPVRENEMLYYEGLPYLVKKINFYSNLSNPLLAEGNIQIPLNDLIPLRSRPIEKSDIWFPTKVGDWIILPGAEQAKQVISQSINQVILKDLGGTRVNYPSSEFYRLPVTNLSHGFRIKVKFGLSYDHLAEITKQIPETFHQKIKNKFSEDGIVADLLQLNVEIAEIADSAIVLIVICNFSGGLADRYQSLQRRINSYVLEICQQEKYQIPFPQLEVRHQNEIPVHKI